jgi:tRNA(Ile)-lysidine synthase
MSFVKRFQTTLESLYTPAEKSKYVIAYSGGLDSHVLLYCFKQVNAAVRAVHVHHGLQTIADDWVNHCRRTCAQLDIPLDVLYVDARQTPGTSPEESARNARYAALQENLVQGECLVTAQHLNDQAETLLLQLFRTASTAGLSAMPAYRQFGDYVHIRPLLAFSREEIEVFAKKNDLHWVEDPSNQDISFDRNFLRNEVIPVLEKRWPEISTQLSKVAELQSSNLQVLEDMAAIDLANAITIPMEQSKVSNCEVLSMLSMTKLTKLSSARLLNLLRYWVIKTLAQQPTRKLLEEIECALINSQQDANPEILFSGYAFRKFQGNLCLLKTKNTAEIKDDVDWVPSTPLVLPARDVQIRAVDSTGKGLSKSLLDRSMKLRFRQGGEKFHPAGRRHSQSLKKLLQEANIPPWERDSIPLLYLDDELIAVVGLWVCKKYSVGEGETGWLVHVEPVA